MELLVAPVSVQVRDQRRHSRIGWRSLVLISLRDLLSTEALISHVENLNEINPIGIQQSEKYKAKQSINLPFINKYIEKSLIEP